MRTKSKTAVLNGPSAGFSCRTVSACNDGAAILDPTKSIGMTGSPAKYTSPRYGLGRSGVVDLVMDVGRAVQAAAQCGGGRRHCLARTVGIGHRGDGREGVAAFGVGELAAAQVVLRDARSPGSMDRVTARREDSCVE